jgi:hypothetical protein
VDGGRAVDSRAGWLSTVGIVKISASGGVGESQRLRM